MMHNGLGEIVKPAFEIDFYQSGFDQLCQVIDQATDETQAQVVLIGMEPTSHYFENLARHLLQQPRPVTLINSFAVKQNRGQQMMHREKTDPIDCGAIGDLLRRGEGTPYKPATGVYLQLQQLDRVRLSKVKIEGMLKNQIIAHLDRIFPGLVILGKAARERYTPLFQVNFWQCKTLQHLIRVCPDPHQLVRMTPEQLVQAFRAHNYRLGHKIAAKIIARAQIALLPEPELVSIRCELLQHDLDLLEVVQTHIAELEQRLTDLVAQTPFQVWVQLKGLSAVQVASLAAAIGDPNNYSHAGQVFRRSGLVSGRNDSGNRQRKGKGNSIVKVGDIYLRRALMSVVTTLLLHQPVLGRYYRKLCRKKHPGVARVATARKMVAILWATLRDQYPVSLISCKGATM
ncbi:MAG: IS110 family transposase [Anaerolineales bacterium]|nr:IS110 family transposase [Anaerolineales bacterium]